MLIPRQDQTGRIAAFETMVATPSIRALIRENKTYRITSDIQTGSRLGMVTLDAHLMELYRQGIISHEELVGKSQDTDTIHQKLLEMELKKR